jgi:hypothetical protein
LLAWLKVSELTTTPVLQKQKSVRRRMRYMDEVYVPTIQ